MIPIRSMNAQDDLMKVTIVCRIVKVQLHIQNTCIAKALNMSPIEIKIHNAKVKLEEIQ